MTCTSATALHDARGKRNQAGPRDSQPSQDPHGDANLGQQAHERGDGEVDSETVEGGHVQQVGAVEHGDAEAGARGQEGIAIVDGAGRGWVAAADADAGVVEQGDVEERGAVCDREAERGALGQEAAAGAGARRGWSAGRWGRGRMRGRGWAAAGQGECCGDVGS